MNYYESYQVALQKRYFGYALLMLKYGVEADSTYINNQNTLGDTILHYAIRRGEISLAKMICQNSQADIHIKNSSGISPYQMYKQLYNQSGYITLD